MKRREITNVFRTQFQDVMCQNYDDRFNMLRVTEENPAAIFFETAPMFFFCNRRYTNSRWWWWWWWHMVISLRSCEMLILILLH